MSFPTSLQILKALPAISPSQRKFHCNSKTKKISAITCAGLDSSNYPELKKCSLAIQFAAILATAAEPVLAVTGDNNTDFDFNTIAIQIGIEAFLYFFVMPPIIMNWMRIRWYKRNALEMYFQFMFAFMFFPGLLLWAPFLNFRKFPRDPSMKYPWSKPANPSEIKGGFLKYPWATPEDYK
ncbi:hypothetical protein Nepgr_017006 [Nepenthes gracilis]|uniref:NADH dehydrogenase-like complex L n=1 Tax=Nepenthes gracilis TaxID=150966 RepID=A0AAD3XT04_NEPGR|nr:hypothetical protein Nepgr_017006 [Nepenthes gracilis]